MKQLLINDEDLETRVALVDDGRLYDYFVERKDSERLVGSIFKGVVRNLEPSLQAAFVDIGAEKNAFLHYWDMLPATQEMLEGADDNEQQGETEQPAQEHPRKNVLANIKARLFHSKQGKGGRAKAHRNIPEGVTVDDIPKLFPVNSEVLVQVTKGQIGTKGARVTTHLSVPGRYLVLLPNSPHVGVSKKIDDAKDRERIRQVLKKMERPKGAGVICRTLGAGKKERVFQQEFEILRAAWQDAEKRIAGGKAPCCVYREPGLAERALRDYLTEDIDEVVCDSNEFQDKANAMLRQFRRDRRVKVRLHKGPAPLFEKMKLNSQIENIFRRKVQLPSGGYICIDETEALIAIDVNSGKSRGGKDHPETILHTNLEAIDEIARQLRLRNLGGLLVLDLIDMRSKTDRQTVYKALKTALAQDRARTKTCPISALGLVEMTRQREYESLLETVFSPCPYCEGKGLVKSPLSISVEIQRKLQSILRRGKQDQVRVIVHPHVLERLKNEDAKALREMEHELGGQLSFRANPELHLEEFRIVDLERGREL